MYGVSAQTIKRRFIALGIYERFYYTSGGNTATLRRKQREEEYSKTPKLCPECNGPLTFDQSVDHTRFCSHSCSQKYRYRQDPNLGAKQGLEIRRRMADGSWKKPNPPQTPKGHIFKPRTIVPCAHCAEPMSLPPSSSHKKYCSRVCASKNPSLGGYREKAGAPRSGWYQGIYCNSSWELAWVLYSLDHSVYFKRCVDRFPYQFEGKTHHYHPDFILSDGTYIEIKGRDSKKWQAKIDQFTLPLRVYYSRDLKPIFSYVNNKYGGDFIRLYEGNPHNQRPNKCVVCGEPCKNQTCSRSCSGKQVATLRGWEKKNLRPSGEPSISPTSHVGVSGQAPD